MSYLLLCRFWVTRDYPYITYTYLPILLLDIPYSSKEKELLTHN